MFNSPEILRAAVVGYVPPCTVLCSNVCTGPHGKVNKPSRRTRRMIFVEMFCCDSNSCHIGKVYMMPQSVYAQPK